MTAFSFSSSKSKPIAIVDIQSGSVSIAIGILHGDKPLEIVAVGRSDLSFEDRSPEATIAALADQIDEAGKKALTAYAELQKTHGPVVHTFAIINTPWAHSQTICTVSKSDTEVLVTEHMIADLAKRALNESTEIDTSNLLEANVVRIELNGYVTTEPSGKHAHKISVYSLVSSCTATVRTIVDNGLQKLFSAPITYRSQLRAIVSVIEALPGIAKDYCLIDITRDSAIIANIHVGRSMGHGAINEGLLSIVRRISGKKMPEETLALLRMVADDTCSTDACAAIIEATARTEPELVRAFAEPMVELAAVRYLPPTLILVCEDALSHWLSELFSRIDFTQFTITTRPFNVVLFNATTLDHLVATAPSIAIGQRLMLAAALVQIEERQT